MVEQVKQEEIVEEKNVEKEKVEASPKKQEGKTEKKLEDKKKEEKLKKKDAITKGKDLHISTKHSIAICNFIKKQKINKAIEKLEKVAEKKIPVPMKGEIPHRKGIERGRYPVKASKVFIKLLKNLAANASVNGLEDPIIEIAKADLASRPYRRFGSRRFKRTNILLIAKPLEKKKPEGEKK